MREYPTSFLHVDAAVCISGSRDLDAADVQWAGVAYAIPDQREKLRLAEVVKYADSFCTNMHKWGLVGFDCCASSRMLD